MIVILLEYKYTTVCNYIYLTFYKRKYDLTHLTLV